MTRTSLDKAKLGREQRLDDAIRYGQLQLAVHILGYARVGHVTGAYIVDELGGGRFVVRISHQAPYCMTCHSDNDYHTALIRLYRARLGDPAEV